MGVSLLVSFKLELVGHDSVLCHLHLSGVICACLQASSLDIDGLSQVSLCDDHGRCCSVEETGCGSEVEAASCGAQVVVHGVVERGFVIGLIVVVVVEDGGCVVHWCSDMVDGGGDVMGGDDLVMDGSDVVSGDDLVMDGDGDGCLSDVSGDGMGDLVVNWDFVMDGDVLLVDWGIVVNLSTNSRMMDRSLMEVCAMGIGMGAHVVLNLVVSVRGIVMEMVWLVTEIVVALVLVVSVIAVVTAIVVMALVGVTRSAVVGSSVAVVRSAVIGRVVDVLDSVRWLVVRSVVDTVSVASDLCSVAIVAVVTIGVSVVGVMGDDWIMDDSGLMDDWSGMDNSGLMDDWGGDNGFMDWCSVDNSGLNDRRGMDNGGLMNDRGVMREGLSVLAVGHWVVLIGPLVRGDLRSDLS